MIEGQAAFAHGSRRAAFGAAAVVALAAVILLALCAPLFEPGRLHVHGKYVDQAGYVTTARRLAETGTLESGVVYPAHVRETAWRLYMPAGYLGLAAAYRVFGYGSWASLAPGLLAFVVATSCLFLAGRRRYGTRAGAVAALLFACFAAPLIYAFTALPVLPPTAASAFTLYLATRPSRGLAVVFMSLSVLVAYLYVETAALLLLPVFLMLLLGAERRASARRAFLAAGLIAVLVLGAQAQQVASGKGVVPLSWVTSGFFNYHDAFLPAQPALGPGAWLALLFENGVRNVGLLWRLVVRGPFELAAVGPLVWLVCSTIALVGGWRRRRVDALPLAAGLLGFALAGACFLLYDVRAHKLIRTALFAVPWSFLGAIGALRPTLGWSLGAGRGRVLRVAGAVALGAYVGLNALTLARESAELRDDQASDALLAEVDASAHPPDRLLMVHFPLGKQLLAYAVERYPARWSFLAANDETFELMIDAGYDVGTLIVSAQPGESPLSPQLIARHRIHAVGALQVEGKRYLVLRRPPAPR